MIQKIPNFDSIPAFGLGITPLAPGGYVCIVKGVKVEHYHAHDSLALAIEIVEGPFAGHFQQIYAMRKASQPEAKWPGSYRQLIPNQNETESNIMM